MRVARGQPLLFVALLAASTGCDGDDPRARSGTDAGAQGAGATRDAQLTDAGAPRRDAAPAGRDAQPSPPDAAAPDAAAPDAAELRPDATVTEPLPTGVTTLTFPQTIDGARVDRSVILHAPRTVDPNQRYPIVLALHGAGGRNQQFVRSLQDQVDAGRMIGVYPQGHNMVWNLGGRESTADDVAFIEDVLDELRRYANLDHSRRFVFGTSNGAGMAHRLAVESRGFKAIATVVTQLTRGNEPTANSETVGVLQVLGVDDRLIPYQGGSGPMGLDFYPGEESARLWAVHDGCTVPGQRSTTAEGNIRIEYTGCDASVRVIHYGIVGAGHGIPRSVEGGLNDLALSFFESTP